MTTENELSVVAAMDVKDEKIPEPLSQKETPAKSEDDPGTTVGDGQPATAPPQNEQTSVEKPKRGGGRKKKADIPDEANTADDGIDTQPLFEQPVVLEGKRSRKPTSRLELTELTPPKKELSIPLGRGKPLGEIEYINHQITHASTDALSRMRSICFGRRGSQANIRKNLRAFSGFEFARDSDEYQRILSNLTKLKKDQLRSMSDILGLPATGRNTEHAERILDFLLEPIDEGKRVPEKKMSMRQNTSKKRSVNSKETINTDEEEEEKEQPVDNGEEIEVEDDDEEEDEEESESDEEYLGDTVVHSKEDPDDFGYHPGKSSKKVTKKKSSTRRAPNTKRKRGASRAKSKRNSKKSKSSTDEKNVEETKENENVPVPIETNEEPKVNNSNGSTVAETNDAESSHPKEPNVSVQKDDSVNKIVKESEKPMNNGVKDMISTTS